jgi:hypothetical protein
MTNIRTPSPPTGEGSFVIGQLIVSEGSNVVYHKAKPLCEEIGNRGRFN